MLPKPPTEQAVSSQSGWIIPPIDGSLTFPEMLQFNLENNPNHPLFIYHNPEDNSVTQISWSRAVRSTHRVISYLTSQFCAEGGPVIAILASLDAIAYWSHINGIILAGCQPFPISPRNSAPAVAHLLAKTHATHLLVGSDLPLRQVAVNAIQILQETAQGTTEIVNTLSIEQLFPTQDEIIPALPPLSKLSLDAPAMILHSSGSTSDFPKPIVLSHRIMVMNTRIAWYGDIDICGHVLGAASLLMFHTMGIIVSSIAVTTGAILSVFKPSSPPTIPRPETVMESYIRTSSTIILCVPSFLEHWSHNPTYVDALKKTASVMFAGGPLPKPVGDMLIKEGVPIACVYGTTELGTLSVAIPKPLPLEDWEYFRLSGMMKPLFIPQEDGTNTFELFILPHEHHLPAVLNAEIDGQHCFATSDLLQRHPTDKTLWKIFGRVDDQIMLSTGEKTNPGPLETIILKSELVSGAVMFGRARFQNGILLEPAREYAFDPQDTGKLADFRNAVWPQIEKANAFAPSHSRLFKEMVIVTSPAKPFIYTAKGTPRRPTILKEYASEIDAAYAAVEQSSQVNAMPPPRWDWEGTRLFVADVLSNVLGSEAVHASDIFHYGCDSLQATWIRNTILRYLKDSGISTKSLPQNFVYTYPTLDTLTRFIVGVASGASSSQADVPLSQVQILRSLVSKYTSSFSAREQPSAPQPPEDQEVVLITGSTGALGASLLSVLVNTPSVVRVYALNRSSKGHDLRVRQREALSERGLDLDVAKEGGKVVLIEGDSAQPDLALSQELLEELRGSVTTIIHNAWAVRWDLQISSLEPLVAGVRNLVNLSLSSTHPEHPKIIFTSSVALLQKWSKSYPAPELPIDVEIVAGTGGYAESKWVSEQILLRASEQTQLRPLIVRVGQLSGADNGAWNAQEWVPSIVRSAEALGCLPDAVGDISWLPLHTAAHAIVEMRHSTQQIVNLVHPQPTTWTAVMRHIAGLLNVPLVPYTSWLGKLEQHDRSRPEVLHRVPALRLIETFRAAHEVQDGGHEALGATKMEFFNAVSAANGTLRPGNLEKLGERDVDKWIWYWREKGFLSRRAQ